MGMKTVICGSILMLCLALDPVASRQAGQAGSDSFDLIIRNGMVYDGTVRGPFPADVAVRGDLIVALAPVIHGRAGRIVDARGLAVMPGFIDIHSHVDAGMAFPENRACLNYLKQGVTTVVVGQCGGSAWPIWDEAKDRIDIWTREGIGPNAALLVGHNSVREKIMGKSSRPPTPADLQAMKDLVKTAMEQGASGLSTGLIYPPGSHARTDEIVELARVIAPFKGIYFTHQRNENSRLLASLDEALEIGEKAGVAVQISHLKIGGRSNWGTIGAACDKIEAARARGVTVAADQYPYRFTNIVPYRELVPRSIWLGSDGPQGLDPADFQSVFQTLPDEQLRGLYEKVTPFFPLTTNHRRYLESLPRTDLVDLVRQNLINPYWFQGAANDRERAQFIARWRDPVKAAEILTALRETLAVTGPENWWVAMSPDPRWEEKSLDEAARLMNLPPEAAAVRLELLGARAVRFAMSREDIDTVITRDWVATGSDGVAPFHGIGAPNIRSYSTFIYKLVEFVQNRKLISLPFAIRSQTSLPADIMSWPDRGRIRVGAKADIAVLDLEHLAAPATLSRPHQYAHGVKYLLINGRLVLDGGEFTGALPGRVLTPRK